MGRKPKTIVEKVLEGADKILHPENHEQDKAEAEKLAADEAQKRADEAAKKSDDESDELTKNQAPPFVESQMGEHKKFDKFKKGESQT